MGHQPQAELAHHSIHSRGFHTFKSLDTGFGAARYNHAATLELLKFRFVSYIAGRQVGRVGVLIEPIAFAHSAVEPFVVRPDARIGLAIAFAAVDEKDDGELGILWAFGARQPLAKRLRLAPDFHVRMKVANSQNVPAQGTVETG